MRYMQTLVVDHNNNKLEKSTLNTIKAAIQLENVDLLVLAIVVKTFVMS